MDIKEDQIQQCVEDIKDRVNREHSSGVLHVISKILNIEPHDVVHQHHLIEKVTAAITGSGEYEMREHGNDQFISKNPNWILNQNLLRTNQSLHTVNTTIIPKIAAIHKTDVILLER